jgi:hypothetical protein
MNLADTSLHDTRIYTKKKRGTMTRFNILLISLFAGLLVAGCVISTDDMLGNWNNDADSDSQTLDLETGDTEHTDPIEWPEYEQQEIVECPPKDLAYHQYELYTELYKNVGKVYARIFEIGSAWLEESKVSECDAATDSDTCLTADYITDAGVKVTYHFTSETVENEEVDSLDDPISETTATERLTVTLPEGMETWTSLTFEKTYEDDDTSWGGLWDVTFTASWTGLLVEEWPADHTISGRVSSWASDMVFEDRAWVSLDGCDIALDGGEEFRSLTVNDQTFEHQYVQIDGTYHLYLTVNGQCVSEIGDYDWEVIGPCPIANEIKQ